MIFVSVVFARPFPIWWIGRKVGYFFLHSVFIARVFRLNNAYKFACPVRLHHVDRARSGTLLKNRIANGSLTGSFAILFDNTYDFDWRIAPFQNHKTSQHSKCTELLKFRCLFDSSAWSLISNWQRTAESLNQSPKKLILEIRQWIFCNSLGRGQVSLIRHKTFGATRYIGSEWSVVT